MGSAWTTDTDPASAPPASDASAFAADQRSRAYPASIGAHYWHLSRNRLIHRALGAAGATAPAIDVGCGPGTTVQYLNQHGFACAGVDLAKYEAADPELARVVIYGQDVFALPAAERERYRTLLLLDVLEHLAEPEVFLARCVEALPRVGDIIITLPARQELFSNYDTYYGHHRRYDRASAAAVCRGAGVELLRCDYFFRALYPAMALQRLIGASRSLAYGPVRRQRWHRALAALFYREATWLPGALPGTSLLLVARPRRAAVTP